MFYWKLTARDITKISNKICSQKGNSRCYECPKDTEAARLWMPATCLAGRPWRESDKNSDVFYQMEGFTLTTSIKIDKKARQGIKTIPCIKNVLLNLTSNWLFNTNCHRVTSRYVTSFFEIFFNLMFLMSMSGWRRVVRLSTPTASRPSGSSHIRTRSTTTRRRTAASAIQSRKFTTVYNSFLKMGQPWHLFRLFLAFSNKQYIFYNKSKWKNVKMSI